MGSAAVSSIHDNEEWTTLLMQISDTLDIKEKSTDEPINPKCHTMSGVIIKIAYAAFAVKLDDCLEYKDKVIYFARFGPTDGTVCPLLDRASSEFDLKVDDHVTCEEFTAFWDSSSARQVNGLWKGGSWGRDNFIYHSKWCTEAYIGDRVDIQFVKNGVIPTPEPDQLFTVDDKVLEKTLNSAWCCNITVAKTKKTYPGYAMNHFMPQFANDLIFIWECKETKNRMVKICKRGDEANVDMKNKLMPGAGEHLEPGETFRLKSSILRAFREELGVSEHALGQCFLLDLGKFDDVARDPRYWTFYHEDKAFGMKRYSTTHGVALYYHGEAPKLEVAADTIEVVELSKGKAWVSLDKLDVTADEWMLDDHAKIIEKAKDSVTRFNELDDGTKQKFLFNTENPSETQMFD